MKICPVCKTESPPSAEFCPKDGATLSEDDGRGTGTKMLYDSLIGELIDGRYKVETRLGEGALSTVYAATHKLIEKRVALKVLKSEFVADPEIVERFLREAKAASRLSHENIISLSDFGKVPSGAPFFVMELLSGRTLADLLYEGKGLPIPEAVRLVTEIGRGLSAAHQHGVVHRDLKPDNVGLVRDAQGMEHVKILDFGLAKITQENRKLTRAGQVLGTPEYMSPEQASGQAVDHRSDVFSLGILLYRLVVGWVPFTGDTFMEVISRVLSESPRAPRTLCDSPELTVALEEIILRALARAPQDRFPTMDAMLEAIRQATEPGADDSVASTWVDPGPPAQEPPLLEDAGTGPTAVAPVVDEDIALGLGPTEAMDTVPEADRATEVTPADAEVKKAQSDQRLDEHAAQSLIRRSAQGRARRRVILGAVIIGLVAIGAGTFLAVFLTQSPRLGSKHAEGDKQGEGASQKQAAPPHMERATPLRPAKRLLAVDLPPRPAPKTVHLDLRSIPSGAMVFLDRKPAGRTPLSRDIAVGSGDVTATFVKAGYRPQQRRFRPQQDIAFTVLLVRVRPTRVPPRPDTLRPRPVPARPRPGNPLGDLKDPFATMKR